MTSSCVFCSGPLVNDLKDISCGPECAYELPEGWDDPDLIEEDSCEA